MLGGCTDWQLYWHVEGEQAEWERCSDQQVFSQRASAAPQEGPAGGATRLSVFHCPRSVWLLLTAAPLPPGPGPGLVFLPDPGAQPGLVTVPGGVEEEEEEGPLGQEPGGEVGL